MTRCQTWCTVVGILSTSACGAADDRSDNDGAGNALGTAPAEPAAQWTIDAEPLLSIGVADGDAARQFHRIEALRRLPDGRIAVLDQSDPHVRVFDAEGSLLASFGADGSGPGEIRISGTGDALLHVGDSLGVATGGRNPAVEWFLMDGTHVRSDRDREEDRGLVPFAVQAHVVAPVGYPEFAAPAAAALAGRPLPQEDVLANYVRTARNGLLWISPLFTGDGSVTWDVADARGAGVARVEVPVEFGIHDSGDGWVLGVFRDSLGVEYVQLRTVDGALPPGSVPMEAGEMNRSAGGTVATDGQVAEATSTMASFLRNLVSRQELHYAGALGNNRFTYTTDLGVLDTEVPDGFAVSIPVAHQEGWAGLVRHDATGTLCVIALDAVSLPGVLPGRVLCYEPPAATVAATGD